MTDAPTIALGHLGGVLGANTLGRALFPPSSVNSPHSPEFRTWWAGHAVTIHAAGTKAIRHPVVGELTVAYETLALSSATDMQIVTYLTDPDTPSADALDLLRS